MRALRLGAWTAVLSCALIGVPATAFADPGTAATAAPLLVEREGHQAATLADGRVLVVGGAVQDGAQASGEVYDPVRDTWTAVAPHADAHRVGHRLTTLADGRVLVTGGRRPGATAYGTDLLYDPATGGWTVVTGRPGFQRLHGAAALLPDGRVLLAGGAPQQDPQRNWFEWRDTAVLYDPADGSWRSTPLMNDYWRSPDAVVLGDGTVLVGGGGVTAVAERYDPRAGTWTAMPAPPGWENDAYTGLPEGRLVAIPGGALLVAADGRTLVFSTASGRWRPGGRLRTPRDGFAVSALATGEVLVAGGSRFSRPAVPEAELYDPRTDLWRDGPAFGAARQWGAVAARAGAGDVLLTGGTTDRRRTDRFTPPAGTPMAAPADAPAAELTAHVHRGTGRAGAPTAVVTHLFSAAGEPLAGQPVRLYSRTAEAPAWTFAGEQTTDAHGGAAFAVTPHAATTYAARHPATAGAAAAVAGDVRYAVTPSPAKPGAPERAIAEPGDRSLRVAWLPPEDDGGHPVTSYTVEALRSGTSAARVTVGGSAREATLTGLDNGVSYGVTVTATTQAGAATAQTTGRPRADAPAPPAPLTGTQVCGRLPFGVTRWTLAGSPYRVCPLGVIVPSGATLELTAAEVRFAGRADPVPPYGLGVVGGALRATGSLLRGESGRPGEWAGVVVDDPAEDVAGDGVPARTGSTVTLGTTTVRHAVDGVRLADGATLLRLDDVVLSDLSRDGLRTVETPVRATRLTVRDAGGAGVATTCRYESPNAALPCAVTLDTVTVERAAGRGLVVETAGPARVTGVTVVASGTKAPVSEAARFTGMTASVGPGRDIDDVRGGGNGIDAVVLDLTASTDLVWRTPVAGSAAAPAPLGYLVAALRLAPGRSLTVPAASVVKGVPAPSDCRAAYYPDYTCTGGIDVTDGTLDASAPGSVFTGAADSGAGITTCPSALAPRCEDTEQPWWNGVTARGAQARVTLTGATVRGAAAGLTLLGKEGGPGFAATVTATAFDRNRVAVNAIGPSVPNGSLRLTDVTVTGGGDVVARRVATTDLTRTTVRRGSVSLAGTDEEIGCTRRTAVSVTDLLVEDAAGSGLVLSWLCHPQVRGAVVRRSGAPRPDQGLGDPAVVVQNTVASYGPGNDVDGLAGGGNGIDGVAVNGYVTGDLVWTSPYNAAGDHPLGYLVGGWPDSLSQHLHVRGTITVPRGGLVASLSDRVIWLEGGSLDASAGGARFVSAYDPLASELGCRSGCEPREWGGIVAWPVPNSGGGAGDVRLAGATVRGGRVEVESQAERLTGLVSITDTTVDGAIRVTRPTRAVVTGSRSGRGFLVREALQADVSRNTVTGEGHRGVWVTGRGEQITTVLTMRDNVAGAGGDGPAFHVADARVTLGPGGTVDGNLASGAGAVLALSGVTADQDLTWITPTPDPLPHPAGYVVSSVYAVSTLRPLRVTGPHTVRLPANAVVKGPLELAGASLDGTAGGAVITATSDDTVGPQTCSWPYDSSGDCGDPLTTPYAGAGGVTVVPDPLTRLAGGVALDRARVNGTVTVTGPSVDAPGAPGFGVAVDSSFVRGGVRATGTAVSVTRTHFAKVSGVHVTGSRGNVVRDVAFDTLYGSGVRLDDAQADVSETVATGPGRAGEGGVRLTGTAGGTFGCLDLRTGFLAHAGSVTVSDSTLTGHAVPPTSGTPRYDLDNTALVTTSGVWWGQAGGPAAGQVRDPARHVDTAPRSAAPACAVAEAAAPPGAPLKVAASPGVQSLTATWSPPSHDGGAPVTAYRVTLLPGGATFVTGAGERSATFTGLTAGEPYVVTVSAANAVGDGPASRGSAPVRPSSGTSPTASPSPTSSPTVSPTASPTVSPSPTPTATVTPTATPSPTGTPSATPSPTSSPTAPARVATALSLSAPGVVTYGRDAVVTGRLTTTGGTALPGRAVKVYVRRAGGSWGVAATVTTSSTGWVSRALRLPATSDVFLAYEGDATTLPTSSALRTVAVRPVVTAAFAKTSITYGTSTTLSGRVSPNLRGHALRLERHTRSGWVRMSGATVTSTSTYRFTVKPGARGTFYYRVVYPGGAAYARAVSPTRALKAG